MDGREYVQAYAEVRTKFSPIDRLPNVLSNGATCAGSAIGKIKDQIQKQKDSMKHNRTTQLWLDMDMGMDMVDIL